MPKALPAALLVVAIVGPEARADGEDGVMFGGGILATHGADEDVAGLGAEMVLWYGPIGVAVEGTRQWGVDGASHASVGTLAGSVRLLAFDHVVPSLLDAREVVDLGIELHAVAERAWWTSRAVERDPVSYGVGVALRLRGASDDDRSHLLAESRVFVRALWSRSSDEIMDLAARDTAAGSSEDGVTVMFGLGALFGGGKTAYVEQLRRRHALDAEWMVR